MIIGNPYQFAVMLDEVPQWNPSSCSFRNGIFFYCFNGVIFPNELLNTTLSTDLRDLLPRMRNVPTNDSLFAGNRSDVFKYLFNLRFPLDWDQEEDCRFDLTPLTFSDKNHYVFAVRGNTGVRILASTVPYISEESTHDLSALDILEAVLSCQEYNDLVTALKLWLDSNR